MNIVHLPKALGFGVLLAICAQAEPVPVARLMEEGKAAYASGALADAADRWLAAAEQSGDPRGQVEAFVRAATAQQALGQQRTAVTTLERALAIAEKSQDRHSLLLAKSSLGVVCTCSRQIGWAETNLREALAMAEADSDTGMAASIWNSLGNLFAERSRTVEALEAYQKSASNGLPAVRVRALANAAAVAAQAGRSAESLQWNESALTGVKELPDGYEQWWLRLRTAQTDLALGQVARAEESARAVLRLAEVAGDNRSASVALGLLGHAAELRSDWKPALELTRQSMLLAQQTQATELLYRWEWQRARVLRAQGDRPNALTTYRRAMQTVLPIRHDLAASCGVGRGAFRENVGALFYELADVLLQEPDTAALREAREVIEQFKAAELDDYLRDPCAAEVRTMHLEDVGKQTAVVYVIPLPNRTELLVAMGGELRRWRVPVTSGKLNETVQEWRRQLETRATNRHLVAGRQLYDWLIAPLATELAKQKVATLVIVPDGALRTVPLGALYDGEHYLIERYAVVVSPGLTLLSPRAVKREQTRTLLGGVSEAVQQYSSLPNVAAELEVVEKNWGGQVRLNKQFALPVLERDFAATQFQVVHLAGHGEFRGDAAESFLLTYDGRLTFDKLEELIRPARYRGAPLELLTLSGCQTAAGDDRAALGLAGVAIKAGARSVLATLWFVHDESTAQFMGEFYRRMRTAPMLSKAAALQQAQMALLQDPRYEHPSYWAAYVLIGNWL